MTIKAQVTPTCGGVIPPEMESRLIGDVFSLVCGRDDILRLVPPAHRWQLFAIRDKYTERVTNPDAA